MFNKLYREEGGQSLVLVALALLAMLALVALVLDGGNAYAQRRRVQNAADAGAVAGARELALGGTDGQIYAEIDEYTRIRNGATSFEAVYIPGGELVGGGAVPSDASGVRVEAVITFPTFFAGVIGLTELTVQAQATSQYGPAQAVGALLPMAINWRDDFKIGEEYKLIADWLGPGGFGWLDWTNDLYADICHPENSGIRRVGDWVNSYPGWSIGQAKQALEDCWMWKPEGERHVTVIVYDDWQGSGSNLKYHIAGFAEFLITGYRFTGEDKWVKGKFVELVEAGAVNLGGPDYGVYGVGLTE